MNLSGKSRELGFDRTGVARIGDLPHADFFRKWLADEWHGEMTYLEKIGPRLDPGAILPGAKSVVCLLKNYYTPDRQSQNPLDGVISRYAWGDDYHDILKRKLHQLADWIRESTGAETRVCVDTGPVLEKLWARQAGLGWQGKHTNLISKEYSSWFFLGVIFVTAELDADEPHEKDHCGTCTKCIEVCPTRAIVAPYKLDARKCISYLTIEHRGPIDRELRPLMGNLIFGCDLCLDVCPWNKYAKEASEFRPRDGLATPKLAALMEMTDDDFRKRFKGSPIKRAKRRGFLRNVAIALGNSRSPEAVPPLIRGLNDSEPLIRMHAAWGLGRVGTTEAVRALGEREAVEKDQGVLAEIRSSTIEANSSSSFRSR